MLAFHGGGGEANGFKAYAGLDAIADREGFITVYPFGTGILPRRWLTWNAGSGCCGYALTQRVDDVGFTMALLDSIARRLGIDARRVYATGHSNGAMMAYRLAVERAHRIAAIVPVAGAMDVASFAPRSSPSFPDSGAEAAVPTKAAFSGSRAKPVIADGSLPNPDVVSLLYTRRPIPGGQAQLRLVPLVDEAAVGPQQMQAEFTQVDHTLAPQPERLRFRTLRVLLRKEPPMNTRSHAENPSASLWAVRNRQCRSARTWRGWHSVRQPCTCLGHHHLLLACSYE